MKGRLMPRARYEPELSDEETALLAAMDDEHKLTVAHAIRLAIIDVRTRDLAVVRALVMAWDSDQFDKFTDAIEQALRAISAFEQFKRPPSTNASDPHAPDPGKLSTRV